ncbi:Noranthrone monooxygenase [Escovopsis weberi]|uniref:Anthrone oxygenase emoM n=1 Tax=Escovopsis weberi TaxID=150374 RepID=EMOM_ESCWE|nr:Noranthrone monooxygenase [Escovopsis weberi]DAB41652.1 TPA_exp: monooxygenase [Escovopsis weberi]
MPRKSASKDRKEARPPASIPRKEARVLVRASAAMTACFLSGAMTGISAITVPVLLDTTAHPAQLLSQWSRLYHYGHIMMPSVAVATTGLFALLALRSKQRQFQLVYAVAGAATIGIVPFTLLFMVATNDALFRLEKLALAAQVGADVASQAVDLIFARELVVKWARLHAIRSLFPLLGGILGMVGLVQELRQ